MKRRWIRWMPAAAMPAVIAAAVLAGPLQASARVDLPGKTPQQVLALMAGSQVHQLSGTLQETANLGLPQLPDLGPGPSGSSSRGSAAPDGTPASGSSPAAANPLTASNISQLVGFLTAPHTVRVYLDGAGNQRVQVLDKLAERDVIRHGTTVWTYDSATNKATELTLPNPRLPKAVTPGSFEHSPDAVRTPAALASGLVKNLDPTTQLSLGANTKVAGHAAYVLQLVPRTGGTLIGKVSIAVDAATGLPLRVTVSARGQDSAALEIGFSKLELTAPPASTFLFTPPPGTSVTRKAVPAVPPLPGHVAAPLTERTPGPAAKMGAAPKVAASGNGWATIAEAPAGTVPASLSGSPALAQLLEPVAGGHALSTPLFTVLITPDGALFAGAVPLAALQQAAAAK
ncbi:hypothetical protein B5P43_21660 [Bacillus sp. SRB_336]|nr:hypothetical protein B5P43_21660 [Bacillus sp. SRB_336]